MPTHMTTQRTPHPCIIQHVQRTYSPSNQTPHHGLHSLLGLTLAGLPKYGSPDLNPASRIISVNLVFLTSPPSAIFGGL